MSRNLWPPYLPFQRNIHKNKISNYSIYNILYSNLFVNYKYWSKQNNKTIYFCGNYDHQNSKFRNLIKNIISY